MTGRGVASIVPEKPTAVDQTDRPTGTPRRDHLVGWTAIAVHASAEETTAKIARILGAFVGDFGRTPVIDARGEFGFGFWRPEKPLPLSTWSAFSDSRFICFVEGVFYDDFGSYRIAQGEDPGLAGALVESMTIERERAIARLTGSFSGFVFDAAASVLTSFVDRFGTRAVYWTQSGEETIISTNLASFRSVMSPQLDLSSAFQFLTVGFPIGERTLLQRVFTQAPASASSFSAGHRVRSRYWTPDPRPRALKMRDAVARITESMEGCVTRISGRWGGALGLGLTGGHDSRIIFGSLLYKSLPFEAFSWRDHNFNDGVVSELCARAGKKPHFAPESAPQNLEDIQLSTFAYTDGQYLHTYGYTWLAQQCSAEGLDALLLGFGGDLLSGSAPVARLGQANCVAELARDELSAQMELLSFRDAESLLNGLSEGMGAEALSSWLMTFQEESWRGSMPDISIWQRLQNRNVKRVGQAMNAARRFVQVFYPYLDSAVMDAYFGLPVRFLDQAPHCFAGFHRFPEFGDLRAVGFPISLRSEARFPSSLRLLRLARAKVGAIRLRSRRRGPGRSESPGDQRAYEEVAESPLFDARHLDELVAQGLIKRRLLRKMQTLARFGRVYLGEGGSADSR